MKDIVLIHGAWHGSWCWDRVRRILERSGFRTAAPCLKGVGERKAELARGIGLEDHIADVMDAVRAAPGKVVLCGHSYGGMLIAAAAGRIPEKIAALVFLDAFLPKNGENLEPYIQEEIDGWLMPPLSAAYFSVNAADRELVDRKCTVQPSATWRDRIRLDRPAGTGIRRKIYVRADGWAPTFARDELRARARGFEVLHVPCGHELMLDLPERTAEIIRSAVETGEPA